jgi:Cu+-exporting ATPase
MIVKSIDPCISAKKIHSIFGISEDMVRVLPKRLHEDFDAETSKAVRLSASMATTGKFSSLAQLIIATKTIHFSAIVGLILQTVSIFLGLGLCMLLIISKAFMTNYIFMSATALIVYNLACTLLTYIAVCLRKS